MTLVEAINGQLERLRELFIIDGVINEEQYITLAMPLHESLLELARKSALTTEVATQTVQGGKQPDEDG